MKVLNFKLLDTLSENSVHLAHVNKFIIHFVNVSSFVDVPRPLFILVQTAELSVLSVAHRDLRFDFL